MPDPYERARSRKNDHLDLARAQQDAPPPSNGFDDLAFVHHALDGTDIGEISLATDVAGLDWSAPLYITGMTGGTSKAFAVNQALAIAARETGTAMASGSVSIALEDPEARESFTIIRRENPDGFVMANIGAHRGADGARRAVELMAADALQVHVNSVQETVMPEGQRDFSSWERSIEEILGAVDVPVIVKEVGFGLSRRTLDRLRGIGVQIADVAGTGGTDFLRIENDRRDRADYSFLIGWGQSAPCCLLDAPQDFPALLASGGVRHPLDVVRSLALGARAAGVAGAFLRVALDGGPDALVAEIGRWRTQIAELMALLGARTPRDLIHHDLLVSGRTAEFARLRGIDVTALARRTEIPSPTGDADVR